MPDLSLCRTLLFLPASNARAIEKARELPVDMIILDLEDAVREEDKGAAREAALEAAREGFGERMTAIRINPAGSPHHGADMLVARRSGVPFVVLPKVENVKEIHDAHTVTERPILSMIESPLGVRDAFAIAGNSVGVIAGLNDLSAELRLPPDGGRRGLAFARQSILLAARAAGVAAFDGVYNHLSDDAGLTEDTEEGRAYGFDGKSVIHPSQIETVNRIFSPSDEELVAAEALVAAASGGAERYEGRMIEAMHVQQARRLIARACR
jgi:citrate lyase subunit beta/citryl-CoA lyase